MLTLGSRQRLICSKCAPSISRCENNACLCEDGYFGRTCSRVIKWMDSDSASITRTLRQFDSISINDYYETGDKTTYFTVQSSSSPTILFVMNQADQKNFDLLFREDRGDQTVTSVIERMDSAKKSLQLDISKKWAGASVINLTPNVVELTFTMTSKLSVVTQGCTPTCTA